MANSDPPGPSPLSSSAMPSSFDSDPDFHEESRVQKLWRKIYQEPLIPLGCAATCYALYMATKSIRAGDHHQTNRMFRARIYAQGFTLVAIVAGSIFYKDERLKRRKFEEKLEEKKTAEKRERWLAELEARDKEDREWRERIEQASSFGAQRDESAVQKVVKEEIQKVKHEAKLVEGQLEDDKKKHGSGSWLSWNKSVLEEVNDQGWGPGMWTNRARNPWRRF